MAEDELYIRAGNSVSKSTASESKSFIYTWTIYDFQRVYEQAKNFIMPTFEDDEEVQLWTIVLNTAKKRYYDTSYLGLDVSFNTEAACIFSDYFTLSVSIIDNNNKEELLHKRSEAAIVSYRIKYLIQKDQLFNEGSLLLPDGNLILKFELEFSKFSQINNYIDSATFISYVNEQKLNVIGSMFNNERFSDAKIIVDSTVIHVHKFILVTQSTVFAAIFEHDMKENNENTIEIKGFDHKVVQEMLRFIYTSQVKDIQVVASDLLIAADMYNLEKLKLLCEDPLISDINVENVTSLLIYAEKYGAKRLKSKALNFFQSNVKEIVESESFEEDFKSLVNFLPSIFKSLVRGL